MTVDRDLAALLRDGMTADVRSVHATPYLVDRIVDAAQAAQADGSVPTDGRPPAWRGWVLPAVAALVVGVLISAVALAGVLLHSRHQQPTSQLTPPPTPRPSPTGPVTRSPDATPTPTSTAGPTQTAPVVPQPPSGGPVPAGFRAVDLTWSSATEGWALGTAPCTTAPCTSIVRTVDGGRHWVGLPAPKAELTEDPAQANCTGCIGQLRFASPMIGYAYGEQAMFMTTDGGATWIKQDGGAHALEIADGTVVRIGYARADCPNVGSGSGCPFKLLRAPVGSSSWQDITLPTGALNTAVTLARSGPVLVVGTFGNPAGGAQESHAVLFSSADDGSTWSRRGDPCPNVTTAPGASGEVDTTSVSIAADRSITVLCSPRGSSAEQWIMTSTDDGQNFAKAPAVLPRAAVLLGSASAKVSFVDVGGVLQRSTDAGRSFSAGALGAPVPSNPTYLGFESNTVGRVLTAPATGSFGNATVWTTTDAGGSWSSYTFP